jgi:hypothetical protein
VQHLRTTKLGLTFKDIFAFSLRLVPQEGSRTAANNGRELVCEVLGLPVMLVETIAGKVQ